MYLVDLIMIFFYRRLFTASLLFLSVLGCFVAKQHDYSKEWSNNTAPKANPAVAVVTAGLVGKQIRTSLGQVLSAPKMSLGHRLKLQDQQILGELANTALDQASDNEVATWAKTKHSVSLMSGLIFYV